MFAAISEINFESLAIMEGEMYWKSLSGLFIVVLKYSRFWGR